MRSGFKKFVVPFIVAPACFLIAAAQQERHAPYEKKLVKTIDSLLRGQVDSNLIPGAVVRVEMGSKVICRQAYGYAQLYDYDQTRLTHPERMTTEHLFDIASLTKVVATTTAIMLLVDRGVLDINDEAGKYIGAFKSADKKAITIRNLLTHTSGLYEWYPLYYRAASKQETFKLIGDLPLKYPVGQGRHYSDLGFTVLGEIIEIVTGIPLDKFVEQNIFQPLGMLHTCYNPAISGRFKKFAATSHGNPYEKRMVYDSSLGFKFKEIIPDRWSGWRTYTLSGEVNDGNAWYANGGVSGAAGIFSTIDDLQKLVDMIRRKGRSGTMQFISEKTVRLFLTKDQFKNGLGWMMDVSNAFMKDAPEGSFGHTGFTGTSIVVVPEYDLSVILLINRQNRGLLPAKEYYNVTPLRQQVFEAVMHFVMQSGKRKM